MAQIQFKSKVKTMYPGHPISYEYIQVPELDRKHCDMSAFRIHQKYGAYANSDLFKAMLARIRSEVFGGKIIKMHSIPEGVDIDTSGFLATVTVNV